MHSVAWSTVCKPKKLGGLGFRDGGLWNKVLIGKFLWAIEFNQESLWLKWINSIYLKKGDF